MFKKLLSLFLTILVFAFVAAPSVFAATPSYKRPNWVFVSDRRVNGKARCFVKAMYRPDDPNSVRIGIMWKTDLVGGWHILDYGDGNTYGSIKKAGAEMHKHFYFNYGSYPVTFTTDAIDGNEVTCSVNININFVPPTI